MCNFAFYKQNFNFKMNKNIEGIKIKDTIMPQTFCKAKTETM